MSNAVPGEPSSNFVSGTILSGARAAFEASPPWGAGRGCDETRAVGLDLRLWAAGVRGSNPNQ